MEKKVKLFRNNEFILVPIEEWLRNNHYVLDEHTKEVFDIVNRTFDNETASNGQEIRDYLRVSFDLDKAKSAHNELIKKSMPFDREILSFISFLYGTSYFDLIGNPSIDEWLNATDMNKPKENDPYNFSLLEAIKYEHGNNALKVKLLSALKYISAQGGS